MSQTVVIIGAGPAGLLLAHYLLQRGNYQVELYERRPDPRSTDAVSDRTFPISLQERGRLALRQIPGLEAAIAAESTRCQGTIAHSRTGKDRSIPRKHPVLSIERHRLVKTLLQHLTETHPAASLTLRFECACVHVNGTARTVTLESEAGEQWTRSYDVLVGADGARSAVRQYLTQATGLQCKQQTIPDAYQSVFVSRCTPSLDLNLAPDRIHVWNLDNKTRLILVPQAQDRLSGTLIFDREHPPLAGLTTPDAVLGYFQEKFPLIGQLMTLTEAEALLHRPVATVSTVECDRYHDVDSRVIVLGDAAHAVSPAIGQGCNASLEDVLILSQLLDQYSDDWSQVLPAFSQQRVPEAYALGELSQYSFPRSAGLVVEFFLRLSLQRLLHRWFPRWVHPFVFDLVLDTNLPYSQVLRLSQGWINKVKRSLPDQSRT